MSECLHFLPTGKLRLMISPLFSKKKKKTQKTEEAWTGIFKQPLLISGYSPTFSPFHLLFFTRTAVTVIT